MIIFLHGQEKYLISRRLWTLKKAFQEKNQTAGIFDFDLEEGFDDKTIRELISGGSGLFSSKKLVILRNIAGLNNFDADNLQQELKVAEKNDDLILIIAETHVKEGKGRLISHLKSKARVEKFDKLKPAETKNWIISETRKRSGGGVCLEDSAVERLAQTSKDDLWKISNELDKLISFAGEGVVTLENINDFCRTDTLAKIFDLVDAIGQRETKKAIALKSKLINQGENEFYVFKMIMFQIRNILKVSQCVEKGIRDPKIISEKLGVHPFVVQKTIRQLFGFNKTKLKQIYGLAAELDLKSKTGEVKMKETLDYFVLKICNS